MEALQGLNDTYSGASKEANKALWEELAQVRSLGEKGNQALGGWPGRISDYMDQVAATPGVGAILPGGVGRDIALRNPWLQPNLDQNVLQVLKARPELMEWYKGASSAGQKRDIIDFITRNYVGQ